MAEDTTTVSDEALQDVSLVDTPIAPKTDAPSAPADQGTDDAAATQDKPQETTKEAEGTPATESTEDTTTQETQTEEPKQFSQEELAAEAKVRAQQEYQNRARTRQHVATQVDQTYGPKTEEQLIEEGMKPDQAAFQAIREEMAFNQERTRIAELNAGLQAEAVNVYSDFPVFNPNNKEYDQEFAQMVEQQYQIAARLQADDQGIVLNAEVPLYDFYKQMAGIYSRGASKGSEQGQQEALQMLARTENVGGSSASGNHSDDLTELEERLGDVVIT